MHLIRSIFYWASDGCPDAVPAGIIAIDLGLNGANVNNPEELQEIVECCCCNGLFDDSCWQIGATNEDVDLIRKNTGPHTSSTLANDQIVPDWQWELIKQRPGLKYSEHNLRQTIEELNRFIEEHEEQD
jgi:hypothetical protein